MGRRNKNSDYVFVPKIIYKEYKNPGLFPVNYEEIYGEDKVRYEDEPIFDENGNFVEMKRNAYVAIGRVVGGYMVKRNKKIDEEKVRKVKQIKLFETYSDVEKRKEESSNLLQNKSLSPSLRESLNN